MIDPAITLDTYHSRGGTRPLLPSPQDVATSGRSEVRFSVDADGELYLYSKSDGVIRKVVRATGFGAAAGVGAVTSPR